MAATISLTALLLTGGLSSRLGWDKATLPQEGEPLWGRQVGLLRELQPQAIWISARTRPDWAPANLPVVLDQPPSRGPLSGISPALCQMESSHLLVLAVDLPRITAGHLRKLASYARPGCGIIPVKQNRFEPLAAIYPKESAAISVGVLASEDVSMNGFVRQLLRENLLVEYPLAEDERLLYFNLNTPGDLSALKSRAASSSRIRGGDVSTDVSTPERLT